GDGQGISCGRKCGLRSAECGVYRVEPLGERPCPDVPHSALRTPHSSHPHNTLPPLTFSTSPVMCRARSQQRNTIGPATSSALATRPNGIVCSLSLFPAPVSRSYGCRDISVSTHPGATQFTPIWRGASSTPSDFVRAMTAPLVAA